MPATQMTSLNDLVAEFRAQQQQQSLIQKQQDDLVTKMQVFLTTQPTTELTSVEGGGSDLTQPASDSILRDAVAPVTRDIVGAGVTPKSSQLDAQPLVPDFDPLVPSVLPVPPSPSVLPSVPIPGLPGLDGLLSPTLPCNLFPPPPVGALAPISSMGIGTDTMAEISRPPLPFPLPPTPPPPVLASHILKPEGGAPPAKKGRLNPTPADIGLMHRSQATSEPLESPQEALSKLVDLLALLKSNPSSTSCCQVANIISATFDHVLGKVGQRDRDQTLLALFATELDKLARCFHSMLTWLT